MLEYIPKAWKLIGHWELKCKTKDSPDLYYKRSQLSYAYLFKSMMGKIFGVLLLVSSILLVVEIGWILFTKLA